MGTQRWLVGIGAGSLVLAGTLGALPSTGIARQDATPAAQDATPAVQGQLLQPEVELAEVLATALDGQDDAEVRSVELDDWDGTLVYGLALDNGAEVYVDATTGEVLESLDAGSATPIEPEIGLIEAQEAALEGQAGAAVSWVGLEDWEGALTYEVALDNGVHVEVDAATGEILSTE